MMPTNQLNPTMNQVLRPPVLKPTTVKTATIDETMASATTRWTMTAIVRAFTPMASAASNAGMVLVDGLAVGILYGAAMGAP